jgi:hypothetical protein
MEFLKKTLEAKKQRAKGIVALLDSKLSGHKPQRSYKTLHVSALTREDGFCPREVSLMQILNRKRKDRYTSAALQVAFDNGNALHDLVRNVWLKDDVVGSWECRGCGVTLTFTKRPKVLCTCKRDLWEYKEEEFTDPITKAVGSIDFFLDIEEGKLVACEAKSMDKDMFNDLKAPLAEHRVRTQAYLTLIFRSGRPEAARIEPGYARVLYISKGFGSKNEIHGKVMPFKEFMVDRNDPVGEATLAKAGLVQAFREGGPIPHGICPTIYAKRAKGCAVAMECFSGKYGAGTYCKSILS